MEKKNIFLKVDYVDGRFYESKFYAINQFMEEGRYDFRSFGGWEVLLDYCLTATFKKIYTDLEHIGLITIQKLDTDYSDYDIF